jgi:general secretion pathway protein A
MYGSFFGLKENPFNLTPDPRYLYLSPQHRDALNYLIYGIKERKGFIVITGGIGTGKTTICRSLLATIDSNVDTALIFNPAVSAIELLGMIGQEFGIKTGRGKPTRKRYLDALNRFLLRNFAEGRNALLLIDEAQNLSPPVMEQIRMLSNLETEREKLLQIVLIGQPELTDILRAPSLSQLNERIAVRYELTALGKEQVVSYIDHRMKVACGEEEHVNFAGSARKIIYRYSQGNPRRINVICDRALLIAYADNLSVIDKSVLNKAVTDIGPGYLGREGFKKKKGPLVLLISLTGALCALIFTLFHDAILHGLSFFLWGRP